MSQKMMWEITIGIIRNKKEYSVIKINQQMTCKQVSELRDFYRKEMEGKATFFQAKVIGVTDNESNEGLTIKKSEIHIPLRTIADFLNKLDKFEEEEVVAHETKTSRVHSRRTRIDKRE